MKLNPLHMRIAHREALIGIAIAIVNFICWFGFAYGLGSKPVLNRSLMSFVENIQ